MKQVIETIKRLCLFCGRCLKGRSDKKYCDGSCRSKYHDEQRKKAEEETRREGKNKN